MQATITDIFKCAPQGHTVETFAIGAIVSGQVAEWAISAGKARAMNDPRTHTQAHTAAPEIKGLSWPELRSMAADVSDAPIRNKADALRALGVTK